MGSVNPSDMRTKRNVHVNFISHSYRLIILQCKQARVSPVWLKRPGMFVLIAYLQCMDLHSSASVEHCSPNAVATGSNSVEAPKNLFGFFFFFLGGGGGAISQLIKLRFTAMVTYSFQNIYFKIFYISCLHLSLISNFVQSYQLQN